MTCHLTVGVHPVTRHARARRAARASRSTSRRCGRRCRWASTSATPPRSRPTSRATVAALAERLPHGHAPPTSPTRLGDPLVGQQPAGAGRRRWPRPRRSTTLGRRLGRCGSAGTCGTRWSRRRRRGRRLRLHRPDAAAAGGHGQGGARAARRRARCGSRDLPGLDPPTRWRWPAGWCAKSVRAWSRRRRPSRPPVVRERRGAPVAAARLRGDPMAGHRRAGRRLPAGRAARAAGAGRRSPSSRLDPRGRARACRPARDRGGAAGAADPPTRAARRRRSAASWAVVERPARAGGDLLGRRSAPTTSCSTLPLDGSAGTRVVRARSTWSAPTAGTTRAARSRAGRSPRRSRRLRPGAVWECSHVGRRPVRGQRRGDAARPLLRPGRRRPGSPTWSPRTSAARCCPTCCAAGRRWRPRRRRRVAHVRRRARRRWRSTHSLRPGRCTSATAGSRSGCGASRATSSSPCRPAPEPEPGLLTCHATHAGAPAGVHRRAVTEVG